MYKRLSTNTKSMEQEYKTEKAIQTEEITHNVTFPIIVIGASIGGMEALKTLVAGLPSNLGAAICIVWHLGPDSQSVLPHVLNKVGVLHATGAVNGESIQINRIYVAQPDHHLLIEGNHLRLTKGPKENRFRPAVDPLFRSAAYTYGSRVIGIVLTGALDDGTAGLWSIKNRGGIAVVQNPEDAEMPSMPRSAAKHVAVNYSVPVADMGRLLVGLVEELNATPFNTSDMKKDLKLEIEIGIAAEKDPASNDTLKLGDLTPFTCPECHGVLTAIKEGSLKRYRCHTGHAFSGDSLLSALTENIEDSLWTTLRSIKESAMLMNHIGDHYAEANETTMAAAYFQKALEAVARVESIRKIAVSHQQLSEENIRQDAGELNINI